MNASNWKTNHNFCFCFFFRFRTAWWLFRKKHTTTRASRIAPFIRVFICFCRTMVLFLHRKKKKEKNANYIYRRRQCPAQHQKRNVFHRLGMTTLNYYLFVLFIGAYIIKCTFKKNSTCIYKYKYMHIMEKILKCIIIICTPKCVCSRHHIHTYYVRTTTRG